MRLSFRLQKSSDCIFDYLTDMQKYVSVHPVIFQIDPTGQASYVVHETLKFGLIPFTFTYPVTIEKSRIEKTVTMRAVVMGFTRIQMNFVLTAHSGSTIVEETILFQSPLPVKFIMEGIFRKQHSQLFKNIEAECDSPC